MMSRQRPVDAGTITGAIGCLTRRLASEVSGQDLIEYGLLASLIAVAAISAVSALGISLFDLWDLIVVDLVGYLS